MRGSDAHPRIAMEILVEQDEIAPVRVFLKFPIPSVTRPLTPFVAREDADQPIGKPARDLVNRDAWLALDRAFDREEGSVRLAELRNIRSS